MMRCPMRKLPRRVTGEFSILCRKCMCVCNEYILNIEVQLCIEIISYSASLLMYANRTSQSSADLVLSNENSAK